MTDLMERVVLDESILDHNLVCGCLHNDGTPCTNLAEWAGSCRRCHTQRGYWCGPCRSIALGLTWPMWHCDYCGDGPERLGKLIEWMPV